MTMLEDKIRTAFQEKAGEIPPDAPPLRLPARPRRSLFLTYGGGGNGGTSARRARHRWMTAAACAVLVVGVIAASSATFGGRPVAPSSTARAGAGHPVLTTRPASYLGVYEAGRSEAAWTPSYPPVAKFTAAADKGPNLVEYISNLGQPFAASYARTLRRHGAIMVVQIDPNGASLAAIAAGSYDEYLSSYADSVRRFGHPVVIGFGHEMNGSWWPWGYGHATPSAFVAAWQHIVKLFRAMGAGNVTWLWTISADSAGTGPIASWWPGSNYVTWIGVDGYFGMPSDTFASVFGSTITQLREFTNRPILLAQTAVARGMDQYTNIRKLFEGMTQYGTLGLVWSDIQTTVGDDWRLEGDAQAEAAFRVGASSLTLAHP